MAWLERELDWEYYCHSSDLAVLTSLYEATGGKDWTRSDGWLGSAATSEWHGLRADSLGRVLGLDLSGNGLTGELPLDLGKLTELTELRLGGNALAGPLPRSLARLALRELHYDDTDLCVPLNASFREWLGAVPSHEGTGQQCSPLSDRDVLELLYEATDGPNWSRPNNWLTNAPLGDWYGIGADARGRVTNIYLGSNGLTGSIPLELGDLSELRSLSLRGNSLSTSIPPELGRLANLTSLELSLNRLTGPIPPSLGDLSNLKRLALLRNRLTGPLPPQLGNLHSLEKLELAQNDLTGALPTALGDLSSLKELYLYENRLTGSIPEEFGSLSDLTHLRLEDNRLTGSVPSSLGRLSRLQQLLLDRNDLSGSIPPELSGLTSLRELGLGGNARLSGALPGSLTALAELQKFRTGGTGLCAPSDDSFQAWLAGIGEQRVGRCTVVSVYLTQAVQSRAFPVPLVGGKEALLRVFVTAERTSGEGIPPVRARFYLGGSETYMVDIPGQEAPIPTEVNESDLRASANAEIPASVVQPGLEMVIDIDPDGTLDPDLGVRRRIPDTGRLEIDVRSMPTLDLTFVPFIYSEAPDSTVLGMVQGMVEDPAGDEMLWAVRTFMPVGDIDAKAHQPVVSSSTRAGDLLHQTGMIRTMEGATGYFMGMMVGGRGYAGLAVGSGRASFARGDPEVMAHELGHNLSLGHSPCGASQFLDPSYPHEGGRIGAWGFDSRDGGRLLAPHSWDLMSYCGPKWISDYNFTKALQYRLRDEGAAARRAAVPTRALLLWGGVDEEGVPFLEPALVTGVAPTLPRSGGDYVLAGRTAAGAELFSLRFDMPEVVDSEEGSSFVFALPAQPEWAGSLAEITLSGPGGSYTLNGETDRPRAILRDLGTGEVRGILRDVNPADVARGAAGSISLEPGIEVLFSRGIPDPADWRR
ncbi:M66 family metalloprotease [Candidatus Palauibacter sp.]|uniref:M66 family metalloprotease n=1 Tax=Candidatus Palauibacter sp. TaxID=3101350 RepID=UPI003B5B172C